MLTKPYLLVSSKYMYTIPPDQTSVILEPYKASTSVNSLGVTSLQPYSEKKTGIDKFLNSAVLSA
ncbi:hypothetical protein WN66_05171 [Saccharomyces cerevisiae]|uniref:Putative uncharacterized protein YMR307C-A n=2 Tax=Saccharomyces cerevisiae TaxID=4932 RepID=YM307_YEAST|nr:RecName: Full=Putative uncharacterized protein YMR307C-A [Saccharomyces cerevisiae S288C]KZV09164.1 hypothetical protein WN66_05171 [Saccharomyces cerevisiae]CAY82144.1 EC1118_1M3_5259p [Saccharomyces cerevisiae EC1118]